MDLLLFLKLVRDEIGAGYTGFLWPLYLDQIKKEGQTKAGLDLLINLNVKKIVLIKFQILLFGV